MHTYVCTRTHFRAHTACKDLFGSDNEEDALDAVDEKEPSTIIATYRVLPDHLQVVMSFEHIFTKDFHSFVYYVHV